MHVMLPAHRYYSYWLLLSTEQALLIHENQRNPGILEELKKSEQLTTDGHKVYLNAVENAFGSEIDYAMLVRVYGKATQ